MDTLRTTLVLAATLTLGLMAGLFYAYAGSVLPALRDAGDRTVVDVMQRINVAIRTGLFLLLFLGGLGFTAGAAALHTGAGRRAVLVPLLVALALYAVTVAVTVVVHLPLNDRLAAAGPPERIADPAAVRAAFSGRWVRWNVVRAGACTGAFGAACWALLRHGGL
jgi:uncharacterized membrane protein